MGELWSAPAKAEQAMEIATQARKDVTAISQDVERFRTTFRIWACSRDTVTRQIRFRLSCHEFE